MILCLWSDVLPITRTRHRTFLRICFTPNSKTLMQKPDWEGAGISRFSLFILDNPLPASCHELSLKGVKFPSEGLLHARQCGWVWISRDTSTLTTRKSNTPYDSFSVNTKLRIYWKNYPPPPEKIQCIRRAKKLQIQIVKDRSTFTTT